MINNNKTISNNEELAETFNKHFSKLVESLDIDKTLASNIASSDIIDPVFNAIKKYENHPSIKKIKQFMSGKDLKFSFIFETKSKILAEIHNLDNKKACQENDIPVKIIKDNIDIFSEFIFHNFNNSIFDATFPSELKNVDVIPVFKKKNRNNVENYRPVSILPNLWKIYERCLYDQMYKYFNHILSKWQCGFRKGFSTQHCLLVMTEKWRKCLDKGGISGAILTDLSKAFDCILHDLLIAKLAAYCFDYQSLRIMESSLSNRQQRTKINNVFSRYSEIIYGVPQGSILGSLLFNVYICDIFFDIIECDIARYADGNTPYNFDFSLDNVISHLEKSTNSLLNWFRENHVKANADKCNLLMSSNESCTAKIEDFSIKNSTKEKLLGVKFDSNLSFENHVTSLCKKASQKLHALARISHYMDLIKRRNLMKAFITSQFSYCPLKWMFHSRSLNNKINRIHERALRLVYQNNLNFSELLDLDNSVTVHQNNFQVLVTEIYKVKNGIAPDIMNDIFELQNPSYNLRSSCNQFRRENIKTVHYGIQSVRYLGPKIWQLVPNDIKYSNSLSKFKKLIKSWKPEACPCRLCNTYVAQVGFI